MAALQEAQRSQEKDLKVANEVELQAFKARHEQLEREATRKAEEAARKEALKVVKPVVSSSSSNNSVKKLVSSRRAKLGITPLIKKH